LASAEKFNIPVKVLINVPSIHGNISAMTAMFLHTSLQPAGYPASFNIANMKRVVKWHFVRQSKIGCVYLFSSHM
jgi:hypothetical protein